MRRVFSKWIMNPHMIHDIYTPVSVPSVKFSKASGLKFSLCAKKILSLTGLDTNFAGVNKLRCNFHRSEAFWAIIPPGFSPGH